jgi:hypothetical protein
VKLSYDSLTENLSPQKTKNLMRIKYRILCSVIALGTLSVLSAHAGPTIVLEGFENGLKTNSQGHTNIEQFTKYGTRTNGTGGNLPTAAVSIYTSAGPGDPRVTEGTHSAKIVFPGSGFGNDFAMGLSDAACSLIEKAAISNQPARYIVRYDVILENINLITYFNEHFFIANAWDYVRSGGGLRTNYNGEQFEIDSYSVAVELPGVGMPTNALSGTNAGDFASSGTPGITGFFSDQFGAVTDPLTNFTIYIDNVRLVDTYESPTTTPVVYPMQSFETSSPPLGGATNLQPADATLALYTTNGQYNMAASGGVAGVSALGPFVFVYMPSQATQENDFAVTDGTNCLEVTNDVTAYNYDIFSIPLAETRLQQILNLNLTPAQLAHYTIRWDVTTPYVPVVTGGGDGDYFQLDYNATTGSILPMSTGRRQSDGQWGLQRETYSATLDQIAYWGVSPALAVSTSIAPNWADDPFYFDNFRLIDTAPGYTVITAESYNAGTQQFTLTWLSEPSETYTVEYATTLPSGFATVLATGVPSGGDFTTKTVTVPGGAAGYLRVRAH